MRVAWWILGLAVACQDRGGLTVADSEVGTDDPSDTDGEVTDTDGGGDGGDDGGGDGGTDTDGGSTDTDVPDDLPEDAEAWHHVLGTFELLPSDVGFDLDGDGGVDNALGSLRNLLGGEIQDILASGENVVVLQTWAVGDADPQAAVGFLGGLDTDGDAADNLDGSEVFEVSEGVSGAGRALAGVPVRIRRDDTYTGTLPPGVIPLFGFEIPTATPILVSGTVTVDDHEIVLGTSITLDTIADLLDQFGLGWAAGFLDGLADVDSNGDRRPDAVSLAIRLEGPSCQVTFTSAP
jgi:hypothetical protein